MINVFRSFSQTYGTSEDFFTACLALFVEGNHDFRDAFLRWLEPHVCVRLRDKSGSVHAQQKHPSKAGEAVLDMVLANPEMELWFEHKIGALPGQYETKEGEQLDQLQKYIDAAKRRMLGVGPDEAVDDRPDVDRSKDGPAGLIFYITRDDKPLDRARYRKDLAEDTDFGLVVPVAQDHLRWRDLWLPAKAALHRTLQGEYGEFERTLARQFLTYWQSQPGMWTQDSHDVAWDDLFEEDETEADGKLRCLKMWGEVEGLARSLEWSPMTDSKGVGKYFAIEQGVLNQVHVGAVQEIGDLAGWSESRGRRVLKIHIRRRHEDREFPRFDPMESYEGWEGQVGRFGRQVEVLVPVRGWDRCRADEDKRGALLGAFVAGLRMFEATTAVKIDGLEDALRRPR